MSTTITNPVFTWHSQLVSFLLRPSSRLHAYLGTIAQSACGPRTCNGGGDAARHAEIAARLDASRRMELKLMPSGRGIGGPSWRPSFVLEMASRLSLLPHLDPPEYRPLLLGLHLRVGDACEGSRPIWQRPACGYSESHGWNAGLAGRLQGLVQSRLDRRRERGLREHVMILLSTDSTRAIRFQKEEIGALFNSTAVHTFAFRRDKYAGSGQNHERRGGERLVAPVSFVENKLRRGGMDARQALGEALLDLGLLAQASFIIGSFYSNFARLALQLSAAAQQPAGPADGRLFKSGYGDYETLDALWCPYHVCQAGSADTHRLCAASRSLAESELSRGSRGGYESFGIRPRRLPPPNASILVAETHRARQPWVKLMLSLVRINKTLVAKTLTQQGTERRQGDDVQMCHDAFQAAAADLVTMPKLY